MTRLVVALLLLGGVCGVGLLVLDRLERRPESVVFGLLLSRGLLVALAGAPAALVAGPDLSDPEIWIGRLSTATLLLVGAIALLRWGSGWTRTRPPGEALWLAGTTYALCLFVIEVAAGDGVQQRTWQIPLALLALWTAHRLDPPLVLHGAKVVLGCYLGLTLLVIAVGAPDAWELADSSFLPWTDSRLLGVTPHPNTLAPLMVTYLLLEHLKPSRLVLRWTGSALALTFLLLSQSKTGLVGAGIVLAVQWLRLPEHRQPRHVVGLAVLCGLAGAAVATLDSPTHALLDPGTLENVRTLTGRTQLWTFALETWRSEPVLGAGPEVFRDYAARAGFEWAGQGHNQFVHALAEGGLVGLGGLLVYLGAICTSAVRSARISRWGSLSVVALLLVRCMTETPLRQFSFEHLLVLALLLAWERARAAQRAAQTSAESPSMPTVPVRTGVGV